MAGHLAGPRLGLLLFGLAVVLTALVLTQVWVRETLPWARADHWATTVPDLRAAGFTVVALALTEQAIDLSDFASRARPGRLALLVGTEGQGLSRTWRSKWTWRSRR